MAPDAVVDAVSDLAEGADSIATADALSDLAEGADSIATADALSDLAEGADSIATADALSDLAEGVDSILDLFRDFELPTSTNEWRHLLSSAAAVVWAALVRFAAVIVAMLRSTNMSHVAIALLVILVLTARVWAKFTGALLGKWFRDPLKEKMGMTYKSIKVSVFRMSVSMTGLELRPSESALAKSIVVAICPSADVKTPCPARKKENDEEEEGRWGKLKERLLLSPRADGQRAGGNDRPPDPFVGSNVHIKETGLSFSFRLVRIEPLTKLTNRRREEQSVMRSGDVDGSKGVSIGDIGSSGENQEELASDGDDLEDGSGTATGNAPVPSSSPSGDKPWYAYVAFYMPAPRIVIKVRGLSIEADKSYLAPEPPAEFLPSQEVFSASLGGLSLTESFEDAFAGNARGERLPAAIPPPYLDPTDKANPRSPRQLPTFEQDLVLENLANSGASIADTLTFYIERWLEHSRNKPRRREDQKKGETGVEQSTVKKEIALDDANGGDNDTLNLVFQEIFRVALSSIEVICLDVRLIIAGADAETVQKARQDHPEPFYANLALAQTSWDQRALTIIGLHRVSVSFEGMDCNAHVVLGGISVKVGLPATASSPRLKSKVVKMIRGFAEKKKDGRTWHDVIPSHEIKLEVFGVLPYLIWSVNYDHHWETRKLGATITASTLPLTLNSVPLFTALLHLDDFSDPNSPYNEWRTWLSKRRVASSALNDDERRLYRKCYQKAKGIKEEDKQKDKRKKTKLIAPEEGGVEGKGSSPSASKAIIESGNIADESLPAETIIDSLEKRMSSDEIMKERCTVMKRKWTPTGDSEADLKDFLSLTNSRVLSRRRSPKSTGPVAFDLDKPTNEDPSNSPFEREYTSPVEALLALCQEKYHLLAPHIACSMRVKTIRLQFVDATSGAKLQGKAAAEAHISTTLAIAGFRLNLYQQNVVFSRSAEEGKERDASPEDMKSSSHSTSGRTKLRSFQRISVTVQSALWVPDEIVAENHDLPLFYQGEAVGLLYKNPHDALPPIVSLSLEHDVDPVQTQDSYFRIGFDVGNLSFVVNPIPLSLSLKALTALADLPFRDLAVEEKMRVKAIMQSDDASRGSHFTFEEEASDSEASKAEPKGILLNGMNVSLAFKVSTVSIVLLSDAQSLHRGTFDVNISEVSLVVESRDGFERADLSIDPVAVYICRVLLATNDFGGMLNLVHLPFKPLLEVDGTMVSYSATLLRGDINTATGSQGASSPIVRTFDTEVTALVPRIATNLSPTIDAMFMGFLNSLAVVLEGLSADDDEIEPQQNKSLTAESASGEEGEEDSHRKALRELWNVADKDGSNTLSLGEVEAIIARLCNSNSMEDMSEELPKAQQLTEEELEREVRYFLSLLGSSSATRDVSFPELDFILFKRQHNITDAGVNTHVGDDIDMGQHHDFIGSDSLHGLIYYEDLREYASTFQVYRLTGINDPHNFPPPSLWRKGEGIGLFWDMYEKETGCSKSSLNGQRIDDVQRKLVRVLNNFDFAKYCWKSLVRPALLDGQGKYLTRSPHGKRPSPRVPRVDVTDWVIDQDTRGAVQSSALDRFVYHVKKLEMDQERQRPQDTRVNISVQYDFKLLVDVDEVSVKIGNGLALAASLLDVVVSRINISANGLLQPSNQGEIFVSQPAASSKSPTAPQVRGVGANLVPWAAARTETSELPDDNLPNNLHFEFVTKVNGMNTKHDKMEDLIEPFSTFGKVSYAITEPAGSASNESQPDTPQMKAFSMRLIVPTFVSVNVSPSSIETLTLLQSIALQSTPEVFVAMALDQQVECIRDLWDYCGKDINDELDIEDLRVILRHFLWFFEDEEKGVKADEKTDALVDSILTLADSDESGTISFAEIEQQIRMDKFMFSPAKVRLHNHLGITFKYCSRSFMAKASHQNPTMTASTLIATLDSIRDNSQRAMHPDMSSVEAAKADGLVLAVPNCKMIDVPVLPYQSLMVHLKSMKLVRKSFRRGARHGGRSQANSSGFEPYLTLVPIALELDSVTINIRSSLKIEAQTPIDIRVVRVSSLDALHGRKNRDGFYKINLAKKNLSKVLEEIVANSPIVFERFGLESGSWVGLPISIMLSSSYHFLIIGDLTSSQQQLWRAPVLLTKDFLYNTMHIGEVARSHALSGIAVQRNRLNVHQSRKSHRTKSAAKQKTAWDTTIQVMPSFVLTNALPFNIKYRCWQKNEKTDDWKAEALAATPDSTRDATRLREGIDEGERRQSAAYQTLTHIAKTEHGRRAYAVIDRLSTGGTARLNGIDMRERLYIQIAQDYVSAQDIDMLVWTAPLKIELGRLRAGGNKSGSMSLPSIKGTVGDNADFFIDATVERNGVPNLTLSSPFWITNKTGMKMLFRFTGREEFMQDSGGGGLPLMAMCHVKDRKQVGSEKREVSILPLEGAGSDCAHNWWDRSTNGELSLNGPPLKEKGKSLVDWSEWVGLDAVGTLGETSCRHLLFGVSIETLTGVFYRTNHISFAPRFIAKNVMHIPITLFPVCGYLGDVQKLTYKLTKKGLSTALREMKYREDAFLTLQPNQSTILYQFEDLFTLRADSEKHRYICMRIDAATWNYKEQWHIVPAEMFGSSYYTERDGVRDTPCGIIKVDCQLTGPTIVASIMISPKSPFRIENRSSSQYLQFVQDDPRGVVIELPPMSFCSYSWDNPFGKKKLRAVVVAEHKSKQYLMESALGAISPTNTAKDDDLSDHSEDETAATMDIYDDAKDDVTNLSRQERQSGKSSGRKASDYANVQSYDTYDTSGSPFIKRKRLQSLRSRSYDPTRVGEHDGLPCVSPEGTSSSILDSNNSEMFVEVRIIAGSRVLSFNDSNWRMQQSELGIHRSGGTWKHMNFHVFAMGASLALVDDFPHEIMNITLRHFSVQKKRGSIETSIRLRHLQIDAMFSSARYPIILESLPLGVDRRFAEAESELIRSFYMAAAESDLSQTDLYWVDTLEWPVPVIEATFSYLPQSQMTWIPALNLFICPMKCQVELGYLLRIADLLIDSLPEPDPHEVMMDTKKTLQGINNLLEYPTRNNADASLTYIENLAITPTYVDTELDVRPEEQDDSADVDDMAEDSMLALSSLGKQTSSNLSAGLLAWVNNVAAKFAHVSPTFKYKELNRVDTYCNAEDLLNEITQFYLLQTIYQSYKVVFSMQLLGDPTELLDHYKTGISDLANVTTGNEAIGKGMTSAVQNLFGGTLEFGGKFTGEFSELLDSLATNEFTSKDFKPSKATATKEAPSNVGDGLIQGTTFLGQTLVHGVAGVIGNPYRGFKKGSPVAVAKGVASGVGGLVVAPFVGALGFTAKILEGTSNTSSLLEVSVIESRCRPARIVSWGTNIGQTAMPYIKGIGIRVHTVRYQKKWKGAQPIETGESGPESKRDESYPRTASEFRRAKADEEKRKNPAKKVVSVMRVRDKKHILTSAAKPILIVDDSKGSDSVSKYVIVFEETITLRCSDLQLSDTLAVYLWHSKSIATTTRAKPISLCKFTVGDMYASMHELYKEQLNQCQLSLTQHSSGALRAAKVDARERAGNVKEEMKPRDVGAAPKRKDAVRPTSAASSGFRAPLPTRMQASMSQMRLKGGHVEDSVAQIGHGSLVAPAIQEFPMMKPIPKKSRSRHANIGSAIQEEMASIKRAEERLMAFFESDSEVSDSDSSFQMDDRARDKDEDEEDAAASMEQLHGHVMLSFYAIPW